MLGEVSLVGGLVTPSRVEEKRLEAEGRKQVEQVKALELKKQAAEQ